VRFYPDVQDSDDFGRFPALYATAFHAVRVRSTDVDAHLARCARWPNLAAPRVLPPGGGAGGAGEAAAIDGVCDDEGPGSDGGELPGSRGSGGWEALMASVDARPAGGAPRHGSLPRGGPTSSRARARAGPKRPWYTPSGPGGWPTPPQAGAWPRWAPGTADPAARNHVHVPGAATSSEALRGLASR
jgi:hypothetical protein